MILIAVFTISHFWSPSLTTFWQSVFVSLFFMVHTHKFVFFFVGAKFIFRIFQLWTEKIQISWRSSLLGDLISFFGGGLEGGARLFSSIKPSMTNEEQRVNSRIVDGKIYANFSPFYLGIIRSRILWLFKCCCSTLFNSQQSVYYCFGSKYVKV